MSSIVRTSEAASLALHATAILAGTGARPFAARRIATLLGVSEAHLAKVLQRLSRAGLVRGTRGPGGGFRLTRPPGHISVREVYEAIEGDLTVQECLFGTPVCKRRNCPLGKLLGKLSDDAVKGLGRMTLADIVLDERKHLGA